MPARKPSQSGVDAPQDLEQFRRPGPVEKPSKPRRSRSRRGVVRADPNTTQLCFRVETPKHTALKAYCVTHRREIGEVMDEILTRFLISIGKS